jgi:hypothetical protein
VVGDEKNPAELRAGSSNSGAGTEKRPKSYGVMVTMGKAMSRKNLGKNVYSRMGKAEYSGPEGRVVFVYAVIS